MRTDVTGGDDLLGLVADRYVKILHYGWPRQPAVNGESGDFCYLKKSNWQWFNPDMLQWSPLTMSLLDKSLPDMAVRNLNLQAAVFVGRNSFGFEGYDMGDDMGKLMVFGSIAQRYREIVGTTGGTGYDKQYYHDPRMQYGTPPHYIEPARTGWAATVWKETGSHIEP